MENSSPSESTHVLYQLLDLDLFKRGILEKYDSYLFKTNNDFKPLLLDVIDMLQEFVIIDDEGAALSNYERKLLTFWAKNLKEIHSNLSKIFNVVILDVTKIVNQDAFAELIHDLHNALQQFHPLLRSALNYILINKIAPDHSKISEYRIDIEKESDETKILVGNAKKLVDDAQLLVDKLALLPTEQQISSFSKMFGDESKSFKNASTLWITGVFLCLGGVVAVSIFYSKMVTDAEFAKYTVNQIIQFNLTKVLTISALFYGLAICNKNYKSSKHNQILNKHRENALASFQAFVEVPTADKETKNAVLLEATRTIFGAQQTGYVATETDDSPNKIIEIIKTINQEK